MQCQIIYITRSARGKVSRSEVAVSGNAIKLGRSTTCEVYLADPRVSLHHATLLDHDGAFYIEAAPSAIITVNGLLERFGRLSEGAKIALGPYDIEVVTPSPGHDLALSIELTRPMGDEMSQLRTRSRIGLAETGLSKRLWSWALFCVVILLFLILPMTGFFSKPARDALANFPAATDQSWDTGEISTAHRFFGSNCNACHQKPFVMVRDNACLECHKDTRNHADPAFFNLAELTETRCATCHKEHKGSQVLVRSDEAFCANCHRRLDEKASQTALLNASDFGRDHPEFRPTFIIGHKPTDIIRVSLKAKAKPVERSNLKFPHDAHLNPGGVNSPGGKVELRCASCHISDEGGMGFKPISMASQCQSCHRLEFEPSVTIRQAPHGSAAEAVLTVEEFYANIALKGGSTDPLAPDIVRRKPGTPLDSATRRQALAWANAKAREVAEDLFEWRVCVTCHEVTRSAFPNAWQIKPVRVADRWLPFSEFNHAKHKTSACGDCHDAAKSKTSADVMIPGLESCRECHGGVQEKKGKLASSCVTCHVFHGKKEFMMGDRTGMTTHGAGGAPLRIKPAASGSPKSDPGGAK